MNKCNILGHKWVPVFIKGQYNGKVIKFIACFCGRDKCRKGYNETQQITLAAINKEFGTYNEKYFEELDE